MDNLMQLVKGRIHVSKWKEKNSFSKAKEKKSHEQRAINRCIAALKLSPEDRDERALADLAHFCSNVRALSNLTQSQQLFLMAGARLEAVPEGHTLWGGVAVFVVLQGCFEYVNASSADLPLEHRAVFNHKVLDGEGPPGEDGIVAASTTASCIAIDADDYRRVLVGGVCMKLQRKVDFLCSHAVFAGVPLADVLRLLTDFRRLVLYKGDDLARAGDEVGEVSVVDSGECAALMDMPAPSKVEVTASPHGASHQIHRRSHATLATLGRSSVIGGVAVASAGGGAPRHAYTVRVVSPEVAVWVVPMAVVLESFPELAVANMVAAAREENSFFQAQARKTTGSMERLSRIPIAAAAERGAEAAEPSRAAGLPGGLRSTWTGGAGVGAVGGAGYEGHTWGTISPRDLSARRRSGRGRAAALAGETGGGGGSGSGSGGCGARARGGGAGYLGGGLGPSGLRAGGARAGRRAAGGIAGGVSGMPPRVAEEPDPMDTQEGDHDDEVGAAGGSGLATVPVYELRRRRVEESKALSAPKSERMAFYFAPPEDKQTLRELHGSMLRHGKEENLGRLRVTRLRMEEGLGLPHFQPKKPGLGRQRGLGGNLEPQQAYDPVGSLSARGGAEGGAPRARRGSGMPAVGSLSARPSSPGGGGDYLQRAGNKARRTSETGRRSSYTGE